MCLSFSSLPLGKPMLTFCSDQKSASKATLLIISAHCTLICVEMQSQSLQTKLLVHEKLNWRTQHRHWGYLLPEIRLELVWSKSLRGGRWGCQILNTTVLPYRPAPSSLQYLWCGRSCAVLMSAGFLPKCMIVLVSFNELGCSLLSSWLWSDLLIDLGTE